MNIILLIKNMNHSKRHKKHTLTAFKETLKGGPPSLVSEMMMMMMLTWTNYKRGVLKKISSTCET
jgi:hypothetical protein